MKNFKKILACLLLQLAANMSYAQYFNELHDVDSMYDWGVDIFLKNDGGYFILGGSQSVHFTKWDMTNLTLSADGNTVLEKNILRYDYSHVHCGDPGGAKHLPGGGYVVPITIQTPNTSYLNSATGFLKLDETGDTVYMKMLTDTGVNFDFMATTVLNADGGFLGGGGRKLSNGASVFPALMVRANSNGDTIWTHIYEKNAAHFAQIRSIIPLSDGRIVVGASSTYTYFRGSSAFYHHTPWFLVLDSDGNILKDTLYGAKYGLGGFIYKDIAGGYIHFGWIDTVAVPAFPNDLHNFPYYIAHLDTNFRIEWLTRFPHDDCNSRRSPWQIKQLRDSTFLILGDDYCNGCLCAPAYSGWVANISRTGAILWNRNYWTDTNEVAYLRDMAERPDGSMVFTGSAFNDTLPSWHGGRDVWIFSTDSNGCVIPGCGDVTNVPDVPQKAAQTFALYPNPTTGSITVNAWAAGELVIYNLQGQVVAAYKLQSGEKRLQLPGNAASGVYVCRFVSNVETDAPVVVRLSVL
jgi:hypothetical protein